MGRQAKRMGIQARGDGTPAPHRSHSPHENALTGEISSRRPVRLAQDFRNLLHLKFRFSADRRHRGFRSRQRQDGSSRPRAHRMRRAFVSMSMRVASFLVMRRPWTCAWEKEDTSVYCAQ